MLTYAIGDIHGCLRHLVELLAQIDRHAVGRPHRLVFLGDLIDRGPDSAGVIGTVRRLQDGRAPGSVVCLQGNHEDLLLQAVGRPALIQNWLYNGGDAALRSFGVDTPSELPGDVVAWVRSCPTVYEDERRCFVHAGLDPGRDRLDQSDHDRLWIRQPFLGVDHDFGRFVVHGHTPCRTGAPDVRPFRVNLDTGAVYGGRLTAGIFGDEQDGPTGFLQV